jgi:transposase
LLKWRRSLCAELNDPEGQQNGFVPAMVVAETTPTCPERRRWAAGWIAESSLTLGATRSLRSWVLEVLGAPMILGPKGVRIWIATSHIDMRKGMQGLALLGQEGLGRDPFADSTATLNWRR